MRGGTWQVTYGSEGQMAGKINASEYAIGMKDRVVQTAHSALDTFSSITFVHGQLGTAK